jgi:hypothetical protein
VACPLTAWEDRSRRLGGEQGLAHGLIDTYEGLSRREIIRCLQRYVARELYHALVSLPASSSSWPAHRLQRVGHP